MTPENGETGNAFEEVDIFKMELSGALWRGAFSSFEDAETRIKQLLVSDPGEYFTHVHSSGSKIFFKPNGADEHDGTR